MANIRRVWEPLYAIDFDSECAEEIPESWRTPLAGSDPISVVEWPDPRLGYGPYGVLGSRSKGVRGFSYYILVRQGAVFGTAAGSPPQNQGSAVLPGSAWGLTDALHFAVWDEVCRLGGRQPFREAMVGKRASRYAIWTAVYRYRLRTLVKWVQEGRLDEEVAKVQGRNYEETRWYALPWRMGGHRQECPYCKRWVLPSGLSTHQRRWVCLGKRLGGSDHDSNRYLVLLPVGEADLRQHPLWATLAELGIRVCFLPYDGHDDHRYMIVATWRDDLQRLEALCRLTGLAMPPSASCRWAEAPPLWPLDRGKGFDVRRELRSGYPIYVPWHLDMIYDTLQAARDRVSPQALAVAAALSGAAGVCN